MPGAVIEAGAVVKYAIIAENARICAGAVVGNSPEEVSDGEWGVAVVAAATKVGKKAVVAAKQMVESDVPSAE